jgi:SAM-dependent methyltransferase
MPRYVPPKLYTELASWFHLLTAPKDYSEEADFIRETLVGASRIPLGTVLELGSGGGNNASHLKSQFVMTLVDLEPGMLDASRTINPECQHVAGDMRSVRLGTQFDAVLVHDAVMYLTTEAELMQCIETAHVHCKPGGPVLFLPDFVRETFVQGIHHGGHDGFGRSLRYIEWIFDPDPSDKTYDVDFAILLREGNEPVRVQHDHHVFGLFSRDEWLKWLWDAGFAPRMIKDPYDREVFVGGKGT